MSRGRVYPTIAIEGAPQSRRAGCRCDVALGSSARSKAPRNEPLRVLSLVSDRGLHRTPWQPKVRVHGWPTSAERSGNAFLWLRKDTPETDQTLRAVLAPRGGRRSACPCRACCNSLRTPSILRAADCAGSLCHERPSAGRAPLSVFRDQGTRMEPGGDPHPADGGVAPKRLAQVHRRVVEVLRGEYGAAIVRLQAERCAVGPPRASGCR